MNLKLISLSFLSVVLLSSCLDCKDCQVATDMNLNVEYYTFDSSTSTYTLDSTRNYSHQGLGALANTNPTILTDLDQYLSPISITEVCGDDLKDLNNSSTSFDQVSGDSAVALFKYSWTENWECK